MRKSGLERSCEFYGGVGRSVFICRVRSLAFCVGFSSIRTGLFFM